MCKHSIESEWESEPKNRNIFWFYHINTDNSRMYIMYTSTHLMCSLQLVGSRPLQVCRSRRVVSMTPQSANLSANLKVLWYNNSDWNDPSTFTTLRGHSNWALVPQMWMRVLNLNDAIVKQIQHSKTQNSTTYSNHMCSTVCHPISLQLPSSTTPTMVFKKDMPLVWEMIWDDPLSYLALSAESSTLCSAILTSTSSL